jgi:fructokinase
MLLSCGDALIDFLPVAAADGRDALVPVVGGSCLNIAVGMARLGASAGFVGGISNDLFGRLIAEHALASQVDLSYARRSDDQTTLAFVRTVAGEPQYAFYDAATATRHWRYQAGTIPFDAIEAIHVGSTTLVDDEGAAQTLAMLDDTKSAVTVSFDPNCRPKLVKDKPRYVARMLEFAAHADIVRMSDVDFSYLFGNADVDARAHALLEAGCGLVVITRGGDGAQAWHSTAGKVEVAAPRVDVVDTIGAGDSFQAALLVALRQIGRIGRDKLRAAGAAELVRALSFASSCAAITCSRAGADPPRQSDVEEAFSRLV